MIIQYLSRFYNEAVSILGRCIQVVILHEVSPEIDFIVVPDGTIHGMDAFMCWETIRYPRLEIVRRDHGIDFRLNTLVHTRIFSAPKVKCQD